MSFNRQVVRHIAGVAITVTFGAAAVVPAQAQSMQSVNDKLSQVQTSLNLFAASVSSSLASISGKLDTILAKLSPPTELPVLVAGPVFLREGEGAFCSFLNTGTTNAFGKVTIYNSSIQKASSQSASAGFGGGAGAGFNAGDSTASAWCKLERGAGGEGIQAVLTTYTSTGATASAIQLRKPD